MPITYYFFSCFTSSQKIPLHIISMFVLFWILINTIITNDKGTSVTWHGGLARSASAEELCAFQSAVFHADSASCLLEIGDQVMINTILADVIKRTGTRAWLWNNWSDGMHHTTNNVSLRSTPWRGHNLTKKKTCTSPLAMNRLYITAHWVARS